MEQIIEIMAQAMHGIEVSLGRMHPWDSTHRKLKEVWRDRAREALSELQDRDYVIVQADVLRAARKNIDAEIQFKLVDAINAALAAEAADPKRHGAAGESPAPENDAHEPQC